MHHATTGRSSLQCTTPLQGGLHYNVPRRCREVCITVHDATKGRSVCITMYYCTPERSRLQCIMPLKILWGPHKMAATNRMDVLPKSVQHHPSNDPFFSWGWGNTSSFVDKFNLWKEDQFIMKYINTESYTSGHVMKVLKRVQFILHFLQSLEGKKKAPFLQKKLSYNSAKSIRFCLSQNWIC